MIEIKPVTLNMLDDWYAALSAVAVEGPYLSFNAPPPKDGSKSYLENMIAENAPFYTAWADTKLVGWCDISLNKTAHNKVFARHIGDFGMAVLHQWRGQGIGQQLLIKHSRMPRTSAWRKFISVFTVITWRQKLCI